MTPFAPGEPLRERLWIRDLASSATSGDLKMVGEVRMLTSSPSCQECENVKDRLKDTERVYLMDMVELVIDQDPLTVRVIRRSELDDDERANAVTAPLDPGSLEPLRSLVR